MAEYVLFSSIIMFALALVWNSSNFLNLSIKVLMFFMTGWAVYMLIGPMNLAGQFAH